MGARKRATILIWSIACLVTAFRASSSELSDEFVVLAEGLDYVRLQSLRQARGHASFLRESNSEKTNLAFDFYIDGQKIRWDARVVGGQMIGGKPLTRILLRKEAYDGEHGFSTVYMDGKTTNTAYVHPPEDYSPFRDRKVYSGYYTGIAFDPRGFYVPVWLAGDDGTVATGLKELVDNGVPAVLEGDISRDSAVVLRVGDVALVEYRLTVDVTNGSGFAITKEEHYFKGKPFETAVREYEHDARSGAVLLKRYASESFGDNPLRQEVKIEYSSVNEPIVRETFTLEGFDLPPDTTIFDIERGLGYTRTPVGEIEKGLDRVLETAKASSPPPPEIQHSGPGRSPDVVAQSSEQGEATAEQRLSGHYQHNWLRYGSVAAALVAVGIVLIAVLVRRRRVKRQATTQ